MCKNVEKKMKLGICSSCWDSSEYTEIYDFPPKIGTWNTYVSKLVDHDILRSMKHV